MVNLLERLLAQSVQPRVPDVRDRDAVVVQERSDHGCAHALALRLRLRSLVDDLVGPRDRVAQDDARPMQAGRLVVALEFLGDVGLAHQVGDGLDRDTARDFAGVVAAHAVGQHVQADVGIERNRVFVVLAHLAGVGQADRQDAIAQ